MTIPDKKGVSNVEQWKYKAADKLRDYKAKKAALQNIPDEIETLKSEARSIKSATADGVAVNGGGSKREDKLLSNIVKRAEMTEALKRAQMAVRMVERGMQVLEPEEKKLLEMMYIDREPGAAEKAAEIMGLADVRSVYKRADKALRRFTIALYGITES